MRINRSKAILGLVMAAAAVVVIAGGLYLQSDEFQEQVRVLLVRKLGEMTGMEAGIDRAGLDVFRRTFSLEGFSLRSSKEKDIAFSAEEITGSFDFLAYWRPHIELLELNLVRPRLVLSRKEEDPFPALEKVFRRAVEIAAGKTRVREGVFIFNDGRIPLDLTLEDLRCAIGYSSSPRGYRIQLSYGNSDLVWAGRNLAHGMETDLTLTPSGLEIGSFVLRRGRTLLRGSGTIHDWSAPALHLETAGLLAGGDLLLLDRSLDQVHTEITLASDLWWDKLGFRSAGRFEAAGADFRGVAANDIKGSYRIENGVMRLDETGGRAAGGRFRATGELQLSGGSDTPHRLTISVQQVPLAIPARIFGIPALDLDNRIDSDLEIAWRQGLPDLHVQGSARLREPDGNAGTDRNTPLAGTLEFAYSQGRVRLGKVELDSTHSAVRLHPAAEGYFRVGLKTDRPVEILYPLRRLSGRLDDWLVRYPDITSLSGRYELDGEFASAFPERTAFKGRVRVSNGRWREYRLDSLTGQASWNGDRLEIQSAALHQGSQVVEGNLRLELPRPGDPIQAASFDGRFDRISLSFLKDLLDSDASLTGVLSGSGRVGYLGGSFEGKAHIRVENGELEGEPFDFLVADAAVADRKVRIEKGEVVREPAQISFSGEGDLTSRQISLRVRMRALPLAEIEAVKEKGLDVEGSLSASGEVRGTLDRPEFAGSFDLAGLRYASWNLGQGSGSVTLRNRILSADADIQSALGGFKGRFRISLDPGYPGIASLDFRDWDVRRIMGEKAPAFLSELSTALQGNIEVEGNFAEPAGLLCRGELDGARFKFRDFQLRNEGKVRFTVSDQKLRLEQARVTGEGTDLSLSGVVPLEKNASLDLRLSGHLNLSLLDHFAPKVGVSGTSELDVSATGPVSDPQIIGQAALENARLDYGDYPYQLSSLTGNITFSRKSVRIESVQGAFASGRIEITGTMEHQNAQVQSVNLQSSIRNARFSYPKDFRTIADADVNLRGGIDSLVLTGEATVLRSEYQRDFNLLEQLAVRPATPPGPQVTDSLLGGIRLNVSVGSNDGLFIDNELTKLQGSMGLTLRGTMAYPSVTGRVEASEGLIFFRGNRFQIIRAVADFVDRNRINPVFDVRAEADVRSYRMVLDVTGDMDHLRFNLASDPPLSTVDIVSLLTTGKSGDTGSATDPRRQTEITGLSAASILSESLTGVIGKRVQRIFGLESFRVDPFLAGAENDPTARVTISERLSQNLAVTFSRNLSTNEEQIVLVEYDVNKNLTVVATRDEDGKYGVDFRFRKRIR